MDEEILQLLKEHSSEFLSGEGIRRHLKISRTAVWKRIQRLRARGYEIEALTRSGYRLLGSPDLLTSAEIQPLLKTKRIGRTIHHFDTLDSTNAKAYQLALDGAEDGVVVIAESQEKGRGRLGRQWVSPPSLNLYLSVILRPKIPPHQASLITLMAAVAAADAIQKVSGLPPLIKWPNDLLLRNRKVAGLLNEIHSEIDRVHFVILGVGVNLNADENTFPEEIRPIATSLKMETGQTISRKVFLQFFLEELERWYSVFIHGDRAVILRAWKRRAHLKGRRVRVTSFGEVLTGTAIDVDSDGALILETEAGERKRVVAGDVEYR
jgi:BirA family biotin operon repressor/biotin-[acetyl-CoA-carboxylase] ligase